ncbi:hypothetical protein INT45_003214 [Circinella minor]|uniref:DNA2/NAM7 helicase-like C-terminal domain-containing protein n=1 Tax=Circinella minor TaxID=1195481 RepID=A0A8H7S7E1_9FUNG|nr:hypothetical protein INT45_003214 [Circinella minor]
MGAPNVGDEVEFDGHLVTIESFIGQKSHSVQNVVAAAAAARAGLTPNPSVIQHVPMAPQLPPTPTPTLSLNELSVGNNIDYRSARKRLRTLGSNNAPSRPRNNFISPQQYVTPSLHEQQVESSIPDYPQQHQSLAQQPSLKQPRVQLPVVETSINPSIAIENNSTAEEEQIQLTTKIQQPGLNDSNNNDNNGNHNKINYIPNYLTSMEINNTSSFPGSSNGASNSMNASGSTINVQQPIRHQEEELLKEDQNNNIKNNDLFKRFSFNENNTTRAPSMKRIGKRVVLPQQQDLIDGNRDDTMEIDSNISSTNTINTATMTTSTTTFMDPTTNSNNNQLSTLSPSQRIQIQPPSLQRRVRVGLSKRTNNALHNDDTINNDTSSSTSKSTIVNNNYYESNDRNNNEQTVTSASSSSFFVKASAVNNEDSAESSFSNSNSNTTINDTIRPPPKPFKVPLADGTSIPIVLQFPTSEKIQAFGKNRTQLKRTKIVPSNFRNSIQYRDTFQKIIHEHLQLLLYTYGGAYFNIYKNIGQKKNELERIFRSKGIGFYDSIEMQRSQGRLSIQERYRLKLHNREHHSKYSKDDIWVISKNPSFDASYTFLSKSIFYGPFSDGYLEIECLTSRDARVANTFMNGNKSTVYALRTISANNEFMMLDALQDKLDHLPLLPYLLCDDKRRNRKRKTQEDLLPVTNLHYINITREDNLDIEQKLQEYIKRYHLNEDQQSVLRQVAKSVIVAPNWNQEPDSPITLVHGVFGSGKSYLAAVIIIFLRDIVDSVNSMREPDDLILFRILIYSMTNVAVDRILISLDKLGYDSFIRVGSLKKISKTILPYTIRAKMSSNEELKELEHMLEDPQNSEEDIELIASTIQKFRKTENTMQLQNMDVVGTTCMASTFDIFGNTSFSLALVDEASQLTEPMSMVPLTRFGCSRLIMIGDPLQLPPTVSTTAEEEKIGQGLDKTLFDRLTEIGHRTIMLRTQYRCHPAISSISNHLFYSRQLQDGITVEDRKPLIEGLPNLMFIDIGGQEQRNFRNNSFWNETEASIATYIIEALIGLSISPNDIGVISLYDNNKFYYGFCYIFTDKEQADKMIEFIGNRSERKQSVQVSTVDAFQGGEKEVIILSTVRTTNSSFIDNCPRVNVAVTRARRHLIILGKQTLLLNNELWGNIVMRCQGKYRNS